MHTIAYYVKNKAYKCIVSGRIIKETDSDITVLINDEILRTIKREMIISVNPVL